MFSTKQKFTPTCNPHESDTEEHSYFIDFKSISLTTSPLPPDTRPHSIIYPHLLFQPFAFTLTLPYPLPLHFPVPYFTSPHTCCPHIATASPLCRSKQTPHCLAPSVPRGTLRLSPNKTFHHQNTPPRFIFNRAIFYSLFINSHTFLYLSYRHRRLSLPYPPHIFAYPSCFAPSTPTLLHLSCITHTHPVLHNKPTLTFSRFIRPRTDPHLFHVEQNKSSPNSDCSITKDIYSESYRPLHEMPHIGVGKPEAPLPYPIGRSRPTGH